MSNSDNTFSFEEAEDSAGFLLWQVTNLWQREIRKALEPHQLTHSQFVLMASIHWLTLHNQEVTQVVLSNNTKIDPMTTSTVLRTLQTKGLVERHEHSTDTRAKVVRLTAQGTAIVKEAVVTVENFDRTFFASLGVDAQFFNQKLKTLLKFES
ncbi:DNA-binding transcriptional regulator, MarR family [Flexibacter flexilis DSM 6793]|uniref:DNA-binding transcriptional regulator, MarR family n=1 Tax=Flexibacter flexilis DSM 6793 TaxID=927664 RepID=A0A1I1JM06_9BACT|nr:MarR family transcriptional regulator [Flexibacter flexilis]SFC49405.1 DNA-binding transcriptional regulator, MarR family [Flexibacter flexilis DSM 6793]